MGTMQPVWEWMDTRTGRWVCTGAALAVIAVAVMAVLNASGNGDIDTREIYARGHKVLVCCRGCGHAERIHLPYETKFPVTCPACKKPEAVRGMRCDHCRTVFPLPQSAAYRCPSCKKVYNTESPDI